MPTLRTLPAKTVPLAWAAPAGPAPLLRTAPPLPVAPAVLVTPVAATDARPCCRSSPAAVLTFRVNTDAIADTRYEPAPSDGGFCPRTR